MICLGHGSFTRAGILGERIGMQLTGGLADRSPVIETLKRQFHILKTGQHSPRSLPNSRKTASELSVLMP
jgi:hypothetical protein